MGGHIMLFITSLYTSLLSSMVAARTKRDERGFVTAESLSIAGVAIVVIIALFGILEASGTNVIQWIETKITSQ